MPKLETSAILQDLLNEINSVDPNMQRPHHEREGDERLVVRIDDPFLQKLHCLGMIYTKEVRRANVDVQFESDPEQKKSLMTQARIAESKAKTMFALMWLLIRERYELWEYDGLGIRKDWEICEAVEKDGPQDFIKKLFGQ